MKKPSFTLSSRTVPVFLLLVTLLGFGLLLPRLGFYWDDWAKILVARLWGPPAYFTYYAQDRPMSSWTHILFTPLLGQTPLPWHIFTLVLRWLSACAMWWTLNGLWPRAQRQNLVAALFFLVYPVFVSQPAAVTFHQQWLQFFLFFVSLGAMLAAQRAYLTGAARRPFWLLTALALVTMLLQLTVTEYFVPLELVRPVALGLLFAGCLPAEMAARGKRGLARLLRIAGRVLRAWSPYLAALAVFVVWRLFFIKLPGPDPYKATFITDFAANPIAAINKVIGVAFVDEWRILVESWTGLSRLQVVDVPPFILLTYALAALAAAGIAVYLLHFPESTNAAAASDGIDRTWLWGALTLGLAAVLLGPVPAWITGRQVVFDFHSDRYAMPAMFGGALLVAALVEWLAARRVQRAVLAGVLVGLALILHLGVANDYRWLWTDETRFFWQLSWRAPGLKAPTAVFTEEEPFPNQGLFSTSAALNLVYPQPEGWGAQADPVNSTAQLKNADDSTHHLAYWFYTLRPRYNNLTASSDPTAQPIALASAFRTLRFKGQTPNSLLLHEDAVHGNCVWVLSARDANNPFISDLERTFLPISNLAQIEPQPLKAGFPPASILGAEPAGAWCYYFEKADLARQLGDWAQVTQLYDQARLRYRMSKSGSNSPYEWLPFIEGLGHTGRWDEALELTNQAMQREAKYQPMLCSIWQDGFKSFDSDAAAQPALTGARQSLGCKQ